MMVLNRMVFVYLNSSSCFVEEDEGNDDPTPAGFIRGYFFGNSFLSNSLVLLMSEFAEIIFSPSHLCPHQQTPSAFIIQVPLPQQRLSSIISHPINLF